MLDIAVVIIMSALFSLVASLMVRHENQQAQVGKPCGYCSNGTDPEVICDACWEERGLGAHLPETLEEAHEMGLHDPQRVSDICPFCPDVDPGGTMTSTGEDVYDFESSGTDWTDKHRCDCCGKLLFPLDDCPCVNGSCSRCGAEVW